MNNQKTLKIIIAPSGKPYAQLESCLKEDVIDWQEAVQKEARHRGQIFSLEAFDYWIRTYFLKGKDIKIATGYIEQGIKCNQKRFMKTSLDQES